MPGAALSCQLRPRPAQATLHLTEEQKQRLLDARRALIKRVEGIVSERRRAQAAIITFFVSISAHTRVQELSACAVLHLLITLCPGLAMACACTGVSSTH